MLLPLLRKEIKELLMERSILVGAIIIPLIVFPIIGALTGLGMSAAMERAEVGLVIGIADLDKTWLTSTHLLELFREKGIRTIEVKCSSEDECVRAAAGKELNAVIMIPSGFTRNFTFGIQSTIMTIYPIRSAAISEISMNQRISTLLLDIFKSLAERVHGGGIDPRFFEKPILENSMVLYLGRILRAPASAVAATFLTTLFGLPLVAVMVASYASTVSATSIALEKESKTLELLLTIPARRITILLSKLLGTFVIVLLSTISFLVGFGIYGMMIAGSMMARIPVEEVAAGQQVSLTLIDLWPSPIFLPILVSAIFIAMVMMTCIGLLVGVLGSDVRSAQQLVGAITFPLLMPPFFILVFAPLESLPIGVRIGLLLDPFTHLFLAIQSGFAGNLTSAITSIMVMLGFAALLLLLSSWLFMGERLITARITLGRRRTSGA
jgi:ABC-2 type transport system permease protein